ncbi:hypothetical protein, partial [Nodularia sphaerocarpa]|uniref:hypothetical protein n=1 Tax=Nodularia sphaerocarpa TaxID=137816 RepID=UPI00232BA67D
VYNIERQYFLAQSLYFFTSNHLTFIQRIFVLLTSCFLGNKNTNCLNLFISDRTNLTKTRCSPPTPRI